MGILEAYDLDDDKLVIYDAYTHCLQKTNRIISGNDKLTVRFSDNLISLNFGQAACNKIPAVTNGKEIELSQTYFSNKIKPLKDRNKICEILLGLNYHELSHCMFSNLSPENFHFLQEYCTKNNLNQMAMGFAWNILEDCRIENLFVYEFEPAKYLFENSIIDLIIKPDKEDEDKKDLVWFFLYGRKYLNKNIYNVALKECQKTFSQDEIKLAKRVIDKYIQTDGILTLQNCKYIEAICKLLYKNSNNSNNNQPQHIAFVCGKEKNEKTLSEEELKELNNSSDSCDNSLENVKEENQKHLKIDIKLLEKAIEKYTKTHTTFSEEACKRHSQSNLINVKDEKIVVNKIKDVLQTLRVDIEPGWLKDQTLGKINIQKYISERERGTLNETFNLWNEGQEQDVTCEVVILVDISGSMQDFINETSRMLWTLKKAFQHFDIDVTVFSFNSDVALVFSKKEKVQENKILCLDVYGGTNPSKAILYANKIFKVSRKEHKILITLTDGEWFNSAECDSYYKELNQKGIYTMLFGLNEATNQFGKHNNIFTKDVVSPKEIVSEVKKLIENIMKNAKVF